MKAWIMSDLHVDVCPRSHPMVFKSRPDHDLVIIAGDIREHMEKGVRWIADQGLNDKPVIYIAGNHEFYRNTVDRGLEKAREEAARHRNIHVLQDQYLDLGGVRFICATLWTDYMLFGLAHHWQAYNAAADIMNDHRLIRVARDGFRRWRTKDAAAAHAVSREFIEWTLAEPFDGPRVVVTHHAPSFKSVQDEYKKNILAAAYASNLEHLVDRADLWIHGHIHPASADYRIGNGRVISNPRGYAYEGQDRMFDPRYTVDLAELRQEAVA